MAKKTDLQEALKRDGGDPSRFAVWGQRWGGDNYATNSRIVVGGSISLSFLATPEAITGEHDTTSTPASSNPIQSIPYEHAVSPGARALIGVTTVHAEPFQRHSSPVPFRSPLLPPTMLTGQTSGVTAQYGALSRNTEPTLSLPTREEGAPGEGYDGMTQTSTSLDSATYYSTFDPQATPALGPMLPSTSAGLHLVHSTNMLGIAFSEHSSSTTHPANLPSTVENAAERNMSQLGEALPTQVELQGTRALLRQTVDLPADSHMYPAQGVQDVSTDQASGQIFRLHTGQCKSTQPSDQSRGRVLLPLPVLDCI